MLDRMKRAYIHMLIEEGQTLEAFCWIYAFSRLYLGTGW